MSQSITYRQHAERVRAEADTATLENVRERLLRAEAAWLAMAQRQETVDRARALREAPSITPIQEPV